MVRAPTERCIAHLSLQAIKSHAQLVKTPLTCEQARARQVVPVVRTLQRILAGLFECMIATPRDHLMRFFMSGRAGYNPVQNTGLYVTC